MATLHHAESQINGVGLGLKRELTPPKKSKPLWA